MRSGEGMIFMSDLSSKPSTIALAFGHEALHEAHLLIDGVAVRFNEDDIVHRRTDASLNAVIVAYVEELEEN